MAVPGAMFFGVPTRIVAGGTAIKGSKGKLWGFLIEGGTTATTLKIKDALTDTGTEIMGAVAPFTDNDASAAGTVFIDLTPFGGLDYGTGIFAVLAGTGSIAYVWFT